MANLHISRLSRTPKRASLEVAKLHEFLAQPPVVVAPRLL